MGLKQPQFGQIIWILNPMQSVPLTNNTEFSSTVNTVHFTHKTHEDSPVKNNLILLFCIFPCYNQKHLTVFLPVPHFPASSIFKTTFPSLEAQMCCGCNSPKDLAGWEF